MKKLFKTISAGLLSMSLLCGAVVMARGINENVENVHAADGNVVTDTLTASNFAATTTAYVNSLNIKINDAVYSGNTAKDKSGNIQIRSKSNSGIVTTTSGGTAKSISVTFGTTPTKSLDIYGNNSAYTAPSNLYGSNNGTKVGSITGSGTYTFTSDYEYIGIRSSSGAMYISKIEISWLSASSDPSISFDKKSIDNLLTGDSDTLSISAANFTPTSYVWESLNEEVATVSGNNETASVTGVKKGSTQIKVTASDGTSSVSETIDVTVLTKPAKIVVGDGSGEMEVEVGKSKRPSVSVFDADNQEITTDEEKAYTMSIVSGSDIVSLSGTTQINGDKVGAAVVRFTSTLVESVY